MLPVDKPTGATSARAVAAVKRALPRGTKVGHTGTLDPLASGLLVLLVGRATRLARYVGEGEKLYTAEARFGAVSDSLDADGELTPVGGDLPTRSEIEAALPRFTGEVEQVPPMASAVKVGGRRLYALHREGKSVERESRVVLVREFALVDYRDGRATFRVRCGGGTYVRSLVADLAESVGSGAYLSALRREAVGEFRLEDALPVGEVTPERVQETLLGARAALGGMRERTVPESLRRLVANGRTLPSSGAQETVAIVSETGELLAVYRDDGEHFARPEVVLCAG